MSVAPAPVPIALDYAAISRSSSTVDVLMNPWIEAEKHYRFPVTRRPLDNMEKFYSLAEAWRQDVRVTSSLTEMILHPAYQRIIGMGFAAVPLHLA